MTDAAASNSPQTITVSLTVQTGPAIALDKATLSPTVTVGQDAPTTASRCGIRGTLP